MNDADHLSGDHLPFVNILFGDVTFQIFHFPYCIIIESYKFFHVDSTHLSTISLKERFAFQFLNSSKTQKF